MAGYLHTTARPVPRTHAPDPHPHWHMFCFNATRDPVEGGRIKAADFAKIYRDRPFYEAAFYSLVAEDLIRKPGCRSSGGPMASGAWPGLQPLGAKVLQANQRDRGRGQTAQTSPMRARKAKLGATTRSKKDKELSPAELQRRHGNGQLSDEDREAIARVRSGDIPSAKVVTAAEAVSYALAHLQRKALGFR